MLCFIFLQAGLRTAAARRNGEITLKRFFAQNKAIQFCRAGTARCQREGKRARRNGPGQPQAGNRGLGAGGERQRIACGECVDRGLVAAVDIAHAETGRLQRLRQAEGIRNRIPPAAGHRLAERPAPRRAAKAHSHAVPAKKAGHGLFGAPHTVPAQAVCGARYGKAQILVIVCRAERGALRQAHVCACQCKISIRRHGVVRARHVMQHKILRRIGIVMAFCAD